VPKPARQIKDEPLVCSYCGRDFTLTSRLSDSVSTDAPLVSDPSKGISLLFGILFVLAIFGIAESIKMLYTGSRAGLIELFIFALLVADAIVLLMAVFEKNEERPGLFRYLGVWILGLIPYFGWLVVYWVGKRIADVIQRYRGNASTIALLLFIGIMVLCLYVYLFVSDSPITSPPT
jgi:hypothetical protein